MARLGPEVLESDEEMDLMEFYLNACGLDYSDILDDERILTAENFQPALNMIFQMHKNRSFRRMSYFVVGYLFLITGTNIPEDLRKDILEATKWEWEDGYWGGEEFAMQRKLCIEDFQEKIRMHRAGIKLHPIRLEEFSNMDLSKAVVGFKQLNETISKGGLDGIRHIKLDGWNLEEIPNPIFDLKQLETLSLQHNQIREIHRDIIKLSSLKWLDLSYNSFVDFPLAILSLESLKELLLDHNFIAEIPESIGKLEMVELLYLDNNLISTLPKSIGKLPHLSTLGICKQDIENIDDVFKPEDFKYDKWGKRIHRIKKSY